MGMGIVTKEKKGIMNKLNERIEEYTNSHYYNLAKANGFTSITSAIAYAVQAKEIESQALKQKKALAEYVEELEKIIATRKSTYKDIETFVRDISEVENPEHLAKHFVRSKARELIERLDRVRREAKNVSSKPETPTNAISVKGNKCLFGKHGCGCGINGYSGQDF
jgi:hypothetical protein